MKHSLKKLITSDLIIIDTEGSSEGLDLSTMNLDLNATVSTQHIFPIPRKNLFGRKKRKYKGVQR